MVVYLVNKEYPYFQQGDREGWLLVRRLFAEANNRVLTVTWSLIVINKGHSQQLIHICHMRIIDTIFSWFALQLRYAILTGFFIIIIIYIIK